jgi:hypothetical protein
VAVYTIDTGQNAGAQDGPISVLWLKAFGCGAIVVPGPGSSDYYHPVRNPRKFDGLLPLVWQEAGDSIYQVPLRSVSLAHVVPPSALVADRPVHGLDVAEIRRYVTALEDPALPPASLAWDNPTRGRITASVNPPNVLSLQVTYDPGWRATSGGHSLAAATRSGLWSSIRSAPESAPSTSNSTPALTALPPWRSAWQQSPRFSDWRCSGDGGTGFSL